MQDLADSPIAPRSGTSAFWLDADHSISVFNASHNDLTVVDHRSGNAVLCLSRGIPPHLAHPCPDIRRKCAKPFLVLRLCNHRKNSAPLHDLIDCGPPKLRDCFSVHDGVDELFSTFRRIHRIPTLFHAIKYPCNALKSIEMGTSPDGRLETCTGVVVQDKCNFPLLLWFVLECDPFPDPVHDLSHPIIDYGVPLKLGSVLFSGCCNADYYRFDHTLELGHRNTPADLGTAQPKDICPPLFFGRMVRHQRMEDRHIESFQHLHGFRIIISEIEDRLEVYERIDPAHEEFFDNLPIRSGTKFDIANPVTEYRNHTGILLKFADQ